MFRSRRLPFEKCQVGERWYSAGLVNMGPETVAGYLVSQWGRVRGCCVLSPRNKWRELVREDVGGETS